MNYILSMVMVRLHEVQVYSEFRPWYTLYSGIYFVTEWVDIAAVTVLLVVGIGLLRTRHRMKE